jgi:DNA-binding NtrC family response regulator
MDALDDTESRVNVMVIDDDEPTLELTRLILERHGFEVRTVDSVRGAFELLHERCPDVVVTDLEMPGLDGFDLRAVMARFAPWVHVIAATGSGDVHVLSRAHDTGFWRVLLKPFVEAVVVDAVTSAYRAGQRSVQRRRPWPGV